MKLNTWIAALAVGLGLGLAGAVHAGEGHDHSPKYGGVVAGGKVFDYELVARPTVVQLYVRAGNQLADVSKASARLTVLTGTDKQEVELKPVGDKLEATGSFKIGPGSKAVAVITVAGKPATARFSLK